MEMLFTAMKTSRKLGATTVAPSRLDRLRPAISSAQRGAINIHSYRQRSAGQMPSSYEPERAACAVLGTCLTAIIHPCSEELLYL